MDLFGKKKEKNQLKKKNLLLYTLVPVGTVVGLGAGIGMGIVLSQFNNTKKDLSQFAFIGYIWVGGNNEGEAKNLANLCFQRMNETIFQGWEEVQLTLNGFDFNDPGSVLGSKMIVSALKDSKHYKGENIVAITDAESAQV